MKARVVLVGASGLFGLAGCAQTAPPPGQASAPTATLAPTPAAALFNGHVLAGAKWIPVGASGWAQTSVNTVVFRNSLATWKDTQFVAFYDGQADVILGKRKVGEMSWTTERTPYQGNASDAHNSISLGVDGQGILHVSWDMHGNKLRYARGKAPGSLELGAEMPMTGDQEDAVTYPQFSTLASGDLLFCYREGASGRGDTMLNAYDTKTAKWRILAHPLITGEGKRNAYTNPVAIDAKGGIHLSWVWRETPDVATNYDICYAYSPDGGKSWQKSNGEKYLLPITAQQAEIAWPVPQKSELINQTSMTTDAENHPLIATYWREEFSRVPQYRLVWNDGQKWRESQIGNRTLGFSLSGGGTKRVPISRPQVVAGKAGEVVVVFRDEERGSEISAAVTRDPARQKWTVQDLLENPIRGMAGVGTWASQAEFKDIRVENAGKTLFSSEGTGLDAWKIQNGDWKMKDGVLTQNSSADNVRALIGDPAWSDYTLTLNARKTGGQEGFLILFGSPGDSSKTWWNLGGWGNTSNALEIPGGGPKGPGHIETGRWYNVKVELQGARVRCYLDGELKQTATSSGAWEPSYDSAAWRQRKLDLFWQLSGQGDAEGKVNLAPQPVGVVEWTP